MDDFLIFDTNKDRLKEIWKEIEKVVNDLNIFVNEDVKIEEVLPN